MCFSFLLLGCFLLERVSGLEPGKDKQDAESVEEVRAHEDYSQTERDPDDVTWIPEAILDVAYYLRKYKFNGHDYRYLMETGVVYKNLYKKFPSPPLKTMHWEVKKNCESSFFSCLEYLQGKISQLELPRHLDTITLIRFNGWTMENDEEKIKSANAACEELREKDEKTFKVFPTPLQRFQWLATASYYMCWYTMKEVSHLARFFEPCDNFADCMELDKGISNGDYRANDEQPFACAMYSFCPDPCCQDKVVKSVNACVEANPCKRTIPKNETCLVNRRENVDMDSILLNYWNVSCSCDDVGLRWESMSGMCVDVDECIEIPTVCDSPSQSCMNLPGSYQCVCNMMGYVEDASGNCAKDPIMQSILHPKKIPRNQKKRSMADIFFDFVYRLKHILSGTHDAEYGEAEELRPRPGEPVISHSGHKGGP